MRTTLPTKPVMAPRFAAKRPVNPAAAVLLNPTPFPWSILRKFDAEPPSSKRTFKIVALILAMEAVVFTAFTGFTIGMVKLLPKEPWNAQPVVPQSVKPDTAPPAAEQ